MNPPHDAHHSDHNPALPAPVAQRLERATHSVLVDPAALQAVRERFDTEQAHILGHYLTQAQSPNTLRAYRTDWSHFTTWCLAEHRQSLPADPVDVAVYLAACAHNRTTNGTWALSPSTLQRRSAAIAAVHAAHGLASPTRTDVVRTTLRGIRRTRRTRPQRKNPLLLTTLEHLLTQRPTDGWPGGVARRRDALLLLTGFAGALRRSELADLDLADLDLRTDPTTGHPTLIIELGATKTDQEGQRGHQIALPRGRHPHTCCLCAYTDWAHLLSLHHTHGHHTLRTHLQNTNTTPPPTTHHCHTLLTHPPQLPPSAPLLPTIDRHGRIAARPMSGRAVTELVKRYAARAGLDPADFGGHSLRAGFATQAALGGAGDREIMRQGRWTNPRTVHDYIRTADPLEDNAVTRLGL